MKMILGEKHKQLGKVVGFVNDNNDKPIFESTRDIKVKLIDWTPIVEKIKNGSESLKDLSLDIRAGKGIIFVGENKKPVLIDEECCGVESDRKNFLVNGKMMSGTFLSGIGVFKKEKGKIFMMPEFYADIDFDDIEKCYTGEYKELWKFMESRYMYNPRIENNTIEIVKYYNGVESKRFSNQD
jgi:hypothetical protein